MASLSLHESTTYHWSLEDDITACRDAGIQAIGIWRRKLDEFGCERGIELINDSGLRVSSLSWAGGFTGANGMSFREAVDDTREAIRIAGAINAECVLVAAGGRNNHILSYATKLVVGALSELADFAAGHGVNLALQPISSPFLEKWSFLSTLDAALQVIGRCRHSRIRLAFDTGELWNEPDLYDRIAQIAPLTALVQLNDVAAVPVSVNDRRLPGDGDVPLFEITQAFVKNGYRGDFELAVWSDELWHSDYHELIHDCRARFDAVCRV